MRTARHTMTERNTHPVRGSVPEKLWASLTPDQQRQLISFLVQPRAPQTNDLSLPMFESSSQAERRVQATKRVADRARVACATFNCGVRVQGLQNLVQNRKVSALAKLRDVIQDVKETFMAVTQTLEKREKDLEFEVSNCASRQESTLTGHAKNLARYQEVSLLE